METPLEPIAKLPPRRKTLFPSSLKSKDSSKEMSASVKERERQEDRSEAVEGVRCKCKGGAALLDMCVMLPAGWGMGRLCIRTRCELVGEGAGGAITFMVVGETSKGSVLLSRLKLLLLLLVVLSVLLLPVLW